MGPTRGAAVRDARNQRGGVDEDWISLDADKDGSGAEIWMDIAVSS
jgi:hypothetical protein